MELLTVDQVAGLLRVSKSWIYQRTRRGEIPVIRIGALLRFEEAAIRQWLAERNHASEKRA